MSERRDSRRSLWRLMRCCCAPSRANHSPSVRVQVALDIEYHRQMLDLHSRVSPTDVVVGWYSTGGVLTETDALIHNFYDRECAHPVLLEFDTGFLDQRRAIRAWVGSALSVKDNVVGTSFVEISVQHRYEDAHRVGMPLLTSAEASAPPSDAAGLASSVRRLHALLELAHDYTDAVCAGKIKADAALGRKLVDAVAAVPRLPRASFDTLFGDAVQDVLLVMYLSQLTRTQLVLANKLNTPILMA